jgi:hypothetical protein
VLFSVIANALIPGVIVGRLAACLRASLPMNRWRPPAILEITSGEILEGGEIVSFHVDAVSAGRRRILTSRLSLEMATEHLFSKFLSVLS